MKRLIALLYLFVFAAVNLIGASSNQLKKTVAYANNIFEIYVQCSIGEYVNWSFYCDPALKIPLNASQAEFLTETENPIMKIRWKSIGVYYYRVYKSDIHGCSNMAIGVILVKNQIPVSITAVPDTVYCLSSGSVLFNPMANDKVSAADFVSSRLSVLSGPKHGIAAIRINNSVVYSNTNDRFSEDSITYKINIDNLIEDSTKVYIKIINQDQFRIQGLSPNGDGLNDKLIFRGLEKFPGSELFVFSSDGQSVFRSKDYLNDWDCRNAHGNRVEAGIYYYILKIGETKKMIKGFLYITH